MMSWVYIGIYISFFVFSHNNAASNRSKTLRTHLHRSQPLISSRHRQLLITIVEEVIMTPTLPLTSIF